MEEYRDGGDDGGKLPFVHAVDAVLPMPRARRKYRRQASKEIVDPLFCQDGDECGGEADD